MTRSGVDPSEFRCSFCNKRQDEVKKLIAGESALICDECVRRFAGTIADRKRSTPDEAPASDRSGSRDAPE